MNKLTEKQKTVLREMVDFTCQQCKNHEDKVGKLEPHRMKRGNAGGLYTPNNILMLCDECHKMMHGGEFK